MEQVTVTRQVSAPPDDVADAMADVGWFMRAADFTEVTVDGDVVSIENRVGFATMSLSIEVVDDPDAALAYEQHDGMFKEMQTRYEVEPVDGGTEVTATTDFELGRGIVGSALDATLVSRQRRSELRTQLDALAERFADVEGDV